MVHIFKNVFKYVLFIFMAIFLLNLYGVNTTSVIAGLGVAGVVLGFALQEALKDIISGISIIFDDFFILNIVEPQKIMIKYCLRVHTVILKKIQFWLIL